MTTKDDLIAKFRDENPTITSIFNGEAIVLSDEEYEITLNNWVAMRLEQIALADSITKTDADKATAQDKLAKLGLTADEIAALLA
jgi:hypothetical protein